MAIKFYKPTTSGRRQMTTTDYRLFLPVQGGAGEEPAGSAEKEFRT